MDRTDSVQHTVLLNQCSNQCYHIHQSARTYVSYNRSTQQVGIAFVTKLHIFILDVVLSTCMFGKFSDWIILINTNPISFLTVYCLILDNLYKLKNQSNKSMYGLILGLLRAHCARPRKPCNNPFVA